MEEIGRIEWKVTESCRFYFKAWGDGEEMKLRLAVDWLARTYDYVRVHSQAVVLRFRLLAVRGLLPL